MRTIKKAKTDFKSTPQYQSNLYFREAKRRSERIENQQFIVPWQIVKIKKREILEE